MQFYFFLIVQYNIHMFFLSNLDFFLIKTYQIEKISYIRTLVFSLSCVLVGYLHNDAPRVR